MIKTKVRAVSNRLHHPIAALRRGFFVFGLTLELNHLYLQTQKIKTKFITLCSASWKLFEQSIGVQLSLIYSFMHQLV